MINTFIDRNETINKIISLGKGAELIFSGYLTSDEQTKLIDYLAEKRVEQKELEKTADISIPNLEVKYGR